MVKDNLLGENKNFPNNRRGAEMYGWAKDLFPIHRSLTGNGVRETLNYLKKLLPGLNLKEVESGSEAYDWRVPKEWEILEAYIENEQGERIVDISDHTLHVVGYSMPVDRWFTKEKLDQHFYSLPHLPDAIPFITSYYNENWGFCLSHNVRENLPDGRYRAVIKSRLFDGVLNYADLLIPGESQQEILFSTYICHPSMANNELSGPVLATALARHIGSLKNRKYSYRFVFVPETIGAIVYLHQNEDQLKQKVKAGFILTCVGDERAWSFMPSRNGNTAADRIAKAVLESGSKDYTEYSFLQRGSDERQYCSPGIDLPVVSIMRSKYFEYPEYHSSLDDLNLISEKGLQESYDLYVELIRRLEKSFYPKVIVKCEPQLGKRGLYPSENVQEIASHVRDMRNLIAYADGSLEVEDLFQKAGVSTESGKKILEKLIHHGLIKDESELIRKDSV